MNNLDPKLPQTQSPQQKKQPQVRGFERIIGSIRKAILTTGTRLIIVGIILLAISMLFEIFGHDNTTSDLKSERQRILAATSGFCFNVGVALIAAGSVVVTVELRSNEEREEKYETLLAKMDDKTKEILGAIEKNAQKKIEDITIASQDTIISSLIQNENIFDQVKSHILRQDFIIKEYLIKVSFDWSGEGRIIEKTYIKYYACNISQHKKSYTIDFYVYNNNLNYHLTPYIIKYDVNNKNFLDSDLSNQIEKQRREAQENIGFNTEIDIDPDSKAKIEIEFIAYREINDHEPFLVEQITDTMTLQIRNIPQNLKVFCVALHPQKNSKEELDQVWKIETGLFPYQGFYLCWQKNQEKNTNNTISVVKNTV